MSRRGPKNVVRFPKTGEETTVLFTSSPRFTLVNRKVHEDVLATDEGAKVLSDWAFNNGCSEVRHQYDGKLSDGEP